MDEFKFVLRCLLFTTVIMFISQYKLNDETLEAKAQYYFVESPTAETLRQGASGGVKFVRGAINEGMGFIKNKMAQNSGESHHEPTQSKYNSDSR
ncbi:MAG: hypothetical protein H7235_08740 [Bdellovibrionaceae bacterium]|nr:hypothetical protein [Pseudobdellovibrionaceae bacterium]